MFSGFNDEKRGYEHDTWQYQGKALPSAARRALRADARRDFAATTSQAWRSSPPPSDRTLQHPNCVYQIMQRHYARYTPEMVERRRPAARRRPS